VYIFFSEKLETRKHLVSFPSDCTTCNVHCRLRISSWPTWFL